MTGFDVADQIVTLIVGAVLFVGLLMLLRRLALWYWKLDRIEKHLAEIAEALRPAERKSGVLRSSRPSST